MISKHLSLLLVIIPLLTGLFSAITFHDKKSYFLAVAASIVTLFISLNVDSSSSYNLGAWAATVGIEYKMNPLSHGLIIYANALLSLLLIGCRDILKQEITATIQPKYTHLFYSVLLFAHAGFSGILVTNDLFNLYVFIEIASLASYILISLNKDKRALIAALDYLIWGSVGAALILIAIGMILALTGTLNLERIQLTIASKKKSLTLVYYFFLFGCLVKVAIFPISKWLTRTYMLASNSILIYFAGVSGLVNLYIFLQGTHFIFCEQLVTTRYLLAAVAYLSVFGGAFRALTAKNLREFIAYSAINHLGYSLLFTIFTQDRQVIVWYLIADSFIKAGLFFVNAQLEYYFTRPLNLSDLAVIKHPVLNITLVVLICANLGFPLTIGFVNKINLLKILIDQHYYQVAAISFASILSFYYNYRVIQSIYDTGERTPKKISLPLMTNLILLTLLGLTIFLILVMKPCA